MAAAFQGSWVLKDVDASNFDQVLANFSSADETWSDCVQVVDVQCSMFMAEWTGPTPPTELAKHQSCGFWSHL